MWKNRIGSLGVCLLLFFWIPTGATGQDVPVKEVIDTIKNMNFVTTTLGIVSNGIPEATVEELTSLQTAMPRQMRIYITESQAAREVFVDFTFLVNDKNVDAVLIWPSEKMNKKSVIKKMCYMSKTKKIPIIALDAGWLDEGAAAVITSNNGTVTVTENSVITKAMKFPIADKPDYTIVQR